MNLSIFYLVLPQVFRNTRCCVGLKVDETIYILILVLPQVFRNTRYCVGLDPH
jgi:hypothetical protein